MHANIERARQALLGTPMRRRYRHALPHFPTAFRMWAARVRGEVGRARDDSTVLRGHSAATRRRKLESAGPGLASRRTCRQGRLNDPQGRKWADRQDETRRSDEECRPNVSPARRAASRSAASAKLRRVTLRSREVYAARNEQIDQRTRPLCTCQLRHCHLQMHRMRRA